MKTLNKIETDWETAGDCHCNIGSCDGYDKHCPDCQPKSKADIHTELKVLELARYDSLDAKRAVIDSFLATKIEELEQLLKDNMGIGTGYTKPSEKLGPWCRHNKNIMGVWSPCDICFPKMEEEDWNEPNCGCNEELRTFCEEHYRPYAGGEPKQPKDWEERFEDLICHDKDCVKHFINDDIEPVKQFISNLLANQRKEIVEKIKKKQHDCVQDCEQNKFIDELLDEIGEE